MTTEEKRITEDRDAEYAQLRITEIACSECESKKSIAAFDKDIESVISFYEKLPGFMFSFEERDEIIFILKLLEYLELDDALYYVDGLCSECRENNIKLIQNSLEDSGGC